MFSWIAANLATILICVVLAALVAGIVVAMVRNRRKGKSACGCGCADCPMQNSCHSKK